MIPILQPSTTLRRVSDPYSVTGGVRVRRHRDGNVTVSTRRLRVVDVVCICGERYAVELTKWVKRPPKHCLHCHHVSMRRCVGLIAGAVKNGRAA